MNIKKVIIAVCSILFIMIGVDKFLSFMEPPCSLMNTISPIIWKVLGVLQLTAGILIWIPKYRKYVAGFFLVLMLFFTIYHLVLKTPILIPPLHIVVFTNYIIRHVDIDLPVY